MSIYGPLNVNQRRFVSEYIKDRKPAAAARRAGYAFENAGVIAQGLLRLPKVQEAIQKETKKIFDKLNVTPEMVLQELYTIAFVNPKDYMTIDDDGNQTIDLSQLPDRVAKALEIEYTESNGSQRVKSIKIRQADKYNALIQIGKHLGMFKEKVEHDVKLTLEQLVNGSFTETRGPNQIDPPLPAIEDKSGTPEGS